MRLSEALRYRAAIEKASESLPDEELLQVPNLAPVWKIGQGYEAGHRVTWEGVLYRCLQTHSAQIGWEPSNAPSLWAKVLIPDEDTIPAWEQPDSTNPYQIGDRVSHMGSIWRSVVSDNIWEPGVYGWEEIS